MIRHLTAVLGAAVGLVTSSYAVAADQGIADRLSARWVNAYETGDSEVIGGIYAVDARVDHGYCAPITGRAAIRDFWHADMSTGELSTVLTVEDSFTDGDITYVSGVYDVLDAAGNPRRVGGGRFTQIWRRLDTDRDWSILRETWINFSCADIRIRKREGPTDPLPIGTRA